MGPDQFLMDQVIGVVLPQVEDSNGCFAPRRASLVSAIGPKAATAGWLGRWSRTRPLW